MTDFDIWSSSATPQPIPADAPARPRLTFFPVDRESAPAFLVLPGGGYAKQADHEAEPVARWLGSLGIVACALHYRVHPDLHPLPLRDARRAVRWVRHHAVRCRIDPARVGVIGFSAGGHLAACTATGLAAGVDEPSDVIDGESATPALAALCYPVISFVDAVHERSMANLLGPDPDTATRRALSPELHANASSPPSFVWHTAEDASVDVANSLLYARALADHDVPVELHVFPRGRHGLGLALDDPSVGRWKGLFESWLRSHGWVGA